MFRSGDYVIHTREDIELDGKTNYTKKFGLKVGEIYEVMCTDGDLFIKLKGRNGGFDVNCFEKVKKPTRVFGIVKFLETINA